MRKDLKMRRGKEIAQGGHASMKFLAEKIRAVKDNRVRSMAGEAQSTGVPKRPRGAANPTSEQPAKREQLR